MKFGVLMFLGAVAEIPLLRDKLTMRPFESPEVYP